MSSVLLKKACFPIEESLYVYLQTYGRIKKLPLLYSELANFSQSIAVYNLKGKDTLWETVFYEPSLVNEIHNGLKQIYSLLKSDGNMKALKHLSVDKIDYCTFGNSKPFRIKILNTLNDNYDYYYIKQADASRVFGLELEDLLSPNRVNYLLHQQTLVEEHIVGIPGDQFMENNLQEDGHNEVRLAKEFVKFNERCYRRLLGDMRAYNFIVDITPDFDQIQYRIRAIDFDQQSYEGRRNFYLPQFFKENKPFVDLGMKHLSKESVEQYQKEERAAIAKRINNDGQQLNDLLKCMKTHTLSTPIKIDSLKTELANKEKNAQFLSCNSMGEILEELLLRP